MLDTREILLKAAREERRRNGWSAEAWMLAACIVGVVLIVCGVHVAHVMKWWRL